MHALEEEPEENGRWKRLAYGALLSAGILSVLGYGATQYEPSRKLIQRVVQMTIAPETPKTPPPPPEMPKNFKPPPPPKMRPQTKKTLPPEAPQQAQADQKPSDQPQDVGLDTSSFSGEGSGPSFQQGDYVMGDPTKSRKSAPAAVAPVSFKKPQLVAARILKQSRVPAYPERARRLGVEGVVVIEVFIDEDGKVTRAKVRAGIDPQLDQLALESVQDWAFAPGTRDGRKMASTRLVRVRYKLER